ncbi:hypothetical protein [Pectobacterium carotovorum]|uniref:hypothetical protein n=1 Tax=Pectobacterium brasiliense TaxID=180957 RepID=UPI000B976D95|nr:hypothetical protein [Pectobacterium carotovorum]OYN54799.1 hypothetical protein B7L52_13520 [Pectobacterium carotovorum]
MKLREKLNLSNILGFVVGVVVTIVINWILFKDPKRVTAPGLAALVALGTFSLALWSAFKVDKWLNSKVNDTAFKKAEEFITELTKLNYRLSVLQNTLRGLTSVKTDKDYLSLKKEISFINGLSYDQLENLFTSVDLFNNWNIKFKYYDKLQEGLFKSGYSIGMMEKLVFSIDNIDDVSGYIEDNRSENLILEHLTPTIKIFSEIIEIPFTEKFDLASPSKKTSE